MTAINSTSSSCWWQDWIMTANCEWTRATFVIKCDELLHDTSLTDPLTHHFTWNHPIFFCANWIAEIMRTTLDSSRSEPWSRLMCNFQPNPKLERAIPAPARHPISSELSEGTSALRECRDYRFQALAPTPREHIVYVCVYGTDNQSDQLSARCWWRFQSNNIHRAVRHHRNELSSLLLFDPMIRKNETQSFLNKSSKRARWKWISDFLRSFPFNDNLNCLWRCEIEKWIMRARYKSELDCSGVKTHRAHIGRKVNDQNPLIAIIHARDFGILAYLSLSLVCQQRCWDFPLAKQTFSQNTKHRKGCAAAPSKGNSNNFHIFHRVLACIIATSSSQTWPNMGFSRWLRGKFTINKGKSRKKVFTFARENNEETSRSWISTWFVTFLTQLHRTCYLHLNSRSSWSLMDFLWLSPEPCYHLKHFNFAFNSSLFLALWFNQSVCFSRTAVYLTFS